MLLSVLHFAFCMGATKECLGKLFQKLNGFQDNINSLFGWDKKNINSFTIFDVVKFWLLDKVLF